MSATFPSLFRANLLRNTELVTTPLLNNLPLLEALGLHTTGSNLSTRRWDTQEVSLVRAGDS